MDRNEILNRIIALAGEHLGAGDHELGEATTAADVAGWNSLNHVMLISAIEKEFGIRFDLLQMVDMQSIGDIARATDEALK